MYHILSKSWCAYIHIYSCLCICILWLVWKQSRLIKDYSKQWPHIGRTVPLLKPPQSPHCHLGAVDHVKILPPPLATRQARSYHAYRATQTPLFSKPLDLAQLCHGNKICSKPALTRKLTLVLAFPAHCISNCKLNGISWTNISKITLNTANERPLPFRCAADPLLGQEVGENVQWSMKAWSGNRRRVDLPLASELNNCLSKGQAGSPTQAMGLIMDNSTHLWQSFRSR